MEYLIHIAIVVAVYSALALSLDILGGHAGLYSMSQAAFWGIGAYASAILSTQYGACLASSMAIGITISVLFSLCLSIPSLRIRDDYFILATLGIQIILTSLMTNLQRLTGGPLGITDIPPLSLLAANSQFSSLFLAAGLLLVIVLVYHTLIRSGFGRVLHVIREDEQLGLALGKNVLITKVAAFALSAAVASCVGSLWARYITYIDPSTFTVSDSLLIISMVLIGGAGSIRGVIAGASILVVLPEALRFLGMPSAIAAQMRQMLYGAGLVCMLLFRPQGILGKRGQ